MEAAVKRRMKMKMRDNHVTVAPIPWDQLNQPPQSKLSLQTNQHHLPNLSALPKASRYVIIYSAHDLLHKNTTHLFMHELMIYLGSTKKERKSKSTMMVSPTLHLKKKGNVKFVCYSLIYCIHCYFSEKIDVCLVW